VLLITAAIRINLDGSYVMYEGTTNTNGKASRFGGVKYGYQKNSANNFYGWGIWAVTKP